MTVRPTPGAAGWPAAMVVWGPGFRSAPHKHHCVQLILAMRGALRIRGLVDEDWQLCGATLIKPDVIHEVDAQRGTVLVAFIDAESALGASLSGRFDRPLYAVPPRTVDAWRRTLGPRPTPASVDRWLAKYLFRGRTERSIHPGVQRALTQIRSSLQSRARLSLDSLAGVANLSRSRFMHVFTEAIGVPLRPYIRWLRVQRAVCELIEGASVTQAAHRAGFSDGAHLTRTFRSMLGMKPSDITFRSRSRRGGAPTQPDRRVPGARSEAERDRPLVNA